MLFPYIKCCGEECVGIVAGSYEFLARSSEIAELEAFT